MSENKKSTAKHSKESGTNRRDFLKGLASIPVFGVFFYSLLEKYSSDNQRKEKILEELGLNKEAPAVHTGPSSGQAGNLIRLGIIGYGGRGEHLVRGAGFAHPDWTAAKAQDALKNKLDKGLEIFLGQDNLNVELTAVCDIFDVHAERGLASSKNDVRPGGAGNLKGARRYRTYRELLASPDVDAVIIATPDHWHAQMAIDAANAGKHVYLEKCITRTEEEVYQLADAVKKSGIVFQLGHQNHQQESHIKAKEIVDKGILGRLSLIETSTNRNSPDGAWYYNIHEKGSPETIDWAQFEEAAPHKVPFSLERFFRWRCWFDYGTGLSGDLLSHEFAAVNQILSLGIPETAVASGGIYFFNDAWDRKKEYKMQEVRDVPDVFNVVFEYPKRNLTLLYSATLANGNGRQRMIMGHDATMYVGDGVEVRIEYDSTRFRQHIDEKLIDTSEPLISYSPGAKGIDAVTSATARYFAQKGLMYTYRGGKQVDTTHLHVKDWIDSIRNGSTPKCDINLGFEEGIACHMATKSYLENRKVTWDPIKRRII
ncbi:MAG: Gfo/Idh/MocA family protein [Candidatus Zhuqueibacterota bacterium]